MEMVFIAVLVIVIVILLGFVIWLGKERNESRRENANIRSHMEGLRQALNEQKAQYEELMESYKTVYEGRDEQLKELDEEVSKTTEEYNRWKDLLEELKAEVDRAKREVEAQRELERRKEEATKADEVWDLEIEDRDLKLVEVLDNLAAQYPELSEDLLSIGWKKVYMPAFQKLVKRRGIEGVGGIYMLKLKEDGRTYVGQATNFKDRWYQHAKKILGVMKSGNELIYGGGWKPEDWYWEVVEEIDAKENSKDYFNARERYWIEYIGGGLNIK